MNSLIRSEEQKKEDLLELELLVQKYNYMALKMFISQDNYYAAERVMSIIEYFKMLMKVNPKGRLAPVGGLDDIMFIGINPSQRSMLVNAWEDVFGQYFGKMLDEAGVDKRRVWLTNVYKRQTEDNRPLTEEEIKTAVDELRVEIKYVNPKIIVTLGKQPAEVMEKYFGDLKGTTEWLALKHPAYIIRNNTPQVRSSYLLELKQLTQYQNHDEN